MEVSSLFASRPAATATSSSAINNTPSSSRPVGHLHLRQSMSMLQAQHNRLFGGTTQNNRRENTPARRRMMEQNNNNKNNNNNNRNNDNDQDDKQNEPAEEDDDDRKDIIPLANYTSTPVDNNEDPATQEPTEEVTQELSQEANKPAAQDEDNNNNNDNNNNDNNAATETRIDLVKLVPFDVKLSLISSELTTGNDALNTFALTDIVTDWMDESLAAQVIRMDLELTHSAFDSVILEERAVQRHVGSVTTVTSSTLTTRNDDVRRQRHLLTTGSSKRTLQQEQQEEVASITIASYEGVTLWKHTSPSNLQVMTPSLLEDIERQALLQDERLLELLQASPAQGLGSNVMDVRAYVNPNPTYPSQTTDTTGATTNTNNPTANTASTTNANLELIIVVAIVVACMAFAFLVFSLFWAWRFDRQRRDAAYRIDTVASPKHSSKSSKQQQQPHHHNRKVKSPDGTGGTGDSDYGDDVGSGGGRLSPANMNVMVNRNNTIDLDDESALYPASETNPTTGNYPESVISEDISTSLTAYYRSGMGTRPLYMSRGSGALANDNAFDDQASLSSMESYGYSLDGYAPSLGGNTWANTNNAAAARAQSDVGDEEDNTRPK